MFPLAVSYDVLFVTKYHNKMEGIYVGIFRCTWLWICREEYKEDVQAIERFDYVNETPII